MRVCDATSLEEMKADSNGRRGKEGRADERKAVAS